jgi:hypothetical protein
MYVVLDGHMQVQSYLLTFSLTHSLTHPPTHSLTHSPTHLPTHPLTHSLTHSMEQSPSWEANQFAASQEILRVLLDLKVHYRTHNWVKIWKTLIKCTSSLIYLLVISQRHVLQFIHFTALLTVYLNALLMVTATPVPRFNLCLVKQNWKNLQNTYSHTK